MGPGDILVFLPSINEIEYFCSEVRASTNGLETFALYSGMATERESRAVARTKSGCRKCTVATNIAEISVTIDGIAYVVDAGLVKQAGFNPRASLNTLQTATISKASAAQRAGRAGRTKPGVCIRLYTEDSFDEDCLASTPVEILMLKSIGFNAVGLFDFIDRPYSEVYYYCLEELFHMGYIDETSNITDKGRRAARLPVDPVWYNAMAEARTLGCLAEMLSIVALATAQSQNSIFLRPLACRDAADAAFQGLFCNTAFRDPGSRAAKGNGPLIENNEDLYRTVHRNHHAALHPGSALISIKHEWVVYGKYMHSGSRQYLQSVTAIKPEWVVDLPYFQDEMLSRKRSEAFRQPYVKRSLDQARGKVTSAT
ncbi:hypothetical protein Neosp_004135 [[Neocosmospora] mangrovei]